MPSASLCGTDDQFGKLWLREKTHSVGRLTPGRQERSKSTTRQSLYPEGVPHLPTLCFEEEMRIWIMFWILEEALGELTASTPPSLPTRRSGAFHD